MKQEVAFGKRNRQEAAPSVAPEVQDSFESLEDPEFEKLRPEMEDLRWRDDDLNKMMGLVNQLEFHTAGAGETHTDDPEALKSARDRAKEYFVGRYRAER